MSVRRRRRQQSGEGRRRAAIPGAGRAGGRGPGAARATGALVHCGALVQRGAGRRGGGVQRWARRLGPRIYRFRPGRLGAQVAVQRGEELGAGGRAGVVREGRQAKQALAEAGQVAAGERLGVLGWGPGNPWSRGGGCGRRESGRAGQGPSRGEGRGGAQRYRGATAAQTETGSQVDGQREKMRETQRQTRAGIINLASEQSLPLPSPPSIAGSAPATPARASVNPPSRPPLPHPRAVPGGSTRLRSLK